MLDARRGGQRQRALPAAQPDAVALGILGSDRDCARIDIRRRGIGARPEMECREGEQAGAGAEIEDVLEALALLLQPVEREQAARSGRVRAGAEGEAGIDAEGRGTFGHLALVGSGMDVEAAGMDRLDPGLAERHPIGVADLLGDRLHALRARHQGAHRVERGAVGLRFEESLELPMVGIVLDPLAGQQHGHRLDAEQCLVIGIDRLRFGAGAGQDELPARHQSISTGRATTTLRSGISIARYCSLRPWRISSARRVGLCIQALSIPSTPASR